MLKVLTMAACGMQSQIRLCFGSQYIWLKESRRGHVD
jgi:hypothetical protein